MLRFPFISKLNIQGLYAFNVRTAHLKHKGLSFFINIPYATISFSTSPTPMTSKMQLQLTCRSGVVKSNTVAIVCLGHLQVQLLEWQLKLDWPIGQGCQQYGPWGWVSGWTYMPQPCALHAACTAGLACAAWCTWGQSRAHTVCSVHAKPALYAGSGASLSQAHRPASAWVQHEAYAPDQHMHATEHKGWRAGTMPVNRPDLASGQTLHPSFSLWAGWFDNPSLGQLLDAETTYSGQ